MSDSRRIVEINGVKVEVDLREAKRVEAFRIGDPVKILHKGRYNGDKWRVSPGIVAGFAGFEKLPTITVAYLDTEFGSGELKFGHINAQSEEFELTSATDSDLSIEKGHIVDIFDRQITTKENELKDLQHKKEYFLKNFKRYFAEATNV